MTAAGSSNDNMAGSEVAELLQKGQISPGDMQSYLNKIQDHYVTENGYEDDDLNATNDRQVICLIMGFLKDSNGMKEWLQKVSQSKKWPHDRDLPLPLEKLAGLPYLCEDERLKFIEVQRKFCASYEMGDHSKIEPPMLPPFYTCGAPLGEGTYAIVEPVELVHHDGEQDAIRYARKRPNTRTNTSDSVLEDELKTFISMGSHHHVVQCVGSYTHNGHMSILLSPQADSNLSQFLDNFVPRKKNILLKSFGCLLSGLGFLSTKMRHKDIKPENILVDGNRLLFTDFGSAYILKKGGSGAATYSTSSTSAGLVNPMYAAPEVISYKETRDVKTDLFSLGCVFAEILAVLSGSTKTNFHKIIKGNNPNIQYAHQIDQLHIWLNELSKTNPELSMPIGWCKKMTQRERFKRPKISVLIQDAKEQCDSNGELKAYFCPDCLKTPAGALPAVPEEGSEGVDNAEVNKSDDYGLTRLSAAAAQRNKERVEWLLDANADAKIQDPNEEGTSLHWAAEGGDPGTIRIILEKSDVDVNANSRTHGTPLSWAVQKKFLDAVRVLLSFKADVNLKNPTGLTPLHLAAQGGDAGLVNLLIEHGADIAETDDKGQTALALAEEGGNEEVAALLRAAMPDDAGPSMAAGSGGSGGSSPVKAMKRELVVPQRPALRDRTGSSRTNSRPTSRPTSPHARFADQEEEIKDIQIIPPESPEEA